MRTTDLRAWFHAHKYTCKKTVRIDAGALEYWAGKHSYLLYVPDWDPSEFVLFAAQAGHVHIGLFLAKRELEP